MDNLKDLSKITTRYTNRVEDLNEKIVSASDKDVKEVASLLGKSANDVQKFVNKYKDLDAGDLIDVIEAGNRRRSSLMIMAAMNNNSKALRQLDKLLGFL